MIKEFLEKITEAHHQKFDETDDEFKCRIKSDMAKESQEQAGEKEGE